MAKVEKKQVKKSANAGILPLERENFIIMGVGLLTIVLGYIALSEKTVEGFMPLTVAPILLVFGYCVIIPFGIMYRKKAKSGSAPDAISESPE